MRLAAGRSSWLPQGNLLFSLETALSQSGGIVRGAETAAAAVAAAAAGQPPPAQVAATLQELKSRAVQVQQLVAALSSRAVGLGGEAGTDSTLQAAAAAAAPPAPAAAEPPLGFQPPRHRVRAALTASMDRMLHSEKLRAVLEPVPLPAVARQAAQAAGGALSAADAAAKEAVELSLGAVQREEQLAAAFGKRAVGSAISKAQSDAEQLSGAAADAQSRLLAWLPQKHAAEEQQQRAAAMAGAPPSRPGGSSSSGSKAAAEASKPSSKVATEVGKPSEPSSSSGGRKISGDMGQVFGSVLSDLKEGYVGLWHSAQQFDAQQAMASLQERVAAGQAAQAQARAAAEAAATGGSGSAAVAKQQVALKQPAGKRQSAVS